MEQLQRKWMDEVVNSVNFPYYSTLDQIYNAEWAINKLARLDLLRESIQTLWPGGHPTQLIHVVGTGGKGSTCRFLERGLGVVGKSGAMMSPHLFDYRERFSIDGEFVSQEAVAWAWEERVKPHCLALARHGQHHPHTFHEVSILIALAIFERDNVAWAAMEASIGGRYDQTRALEVAAVALTNVGSDHAHLLGKEQWQRVLDKAGAARPGVPFFTTDRDPENLAIIATVCQQTGAPLQVIDQAAVEELTGKLADHTSAEPGLIQAGYQKWNAALSLAVIRHLHPQLDEQRLLAALARAQLPGRLWRVAEGLYADIAHNAEKMQALLGELERQFPSAGKIFVIGLSGPRGSLKVFGALAQAAKAIIVTGASFKGQDPHAVREEIAGLLGATPALVVDDPQQALAVAQSLRGPEDIVLLTGSTYTIEQALNPDPYLRSLNSSFGWRTAVDLTAHGEVQLTLPKPPPVLR
jgi:dihydrofolate synthase / folylpolyglutamate synthase